MISIGKREIVFLVSRYDPSLQRWLRVASMGTKRLGVAVAVLDGYLYAIGGSDGQSPLSTGNKTNLDIFIISGLPLSSRTIRSKNK